MPSKNALAGAEGSENDGHRALAGELRNRAKEATLQNSAQSPEVLVYKQVRLLLDHAADYIRNLRRFSSALMKMHVVWAVRGLPMPDIDSNGTHVAGYLSQPAIENEPHDEETRQT